VGLSGASTGSLSPAYSAFLLPKTDAGLRMERTGVELLGTGPEKFLVAGVKGLIDAGPTECFMMSRFVVRCRSMEEGMVDSK